MAIDHISLNSCKYRGYFADLAGGKWQVDILAAGGSAAPIRLAYENPLVIEWRGDELFDPIVRSRATLRVLSDTDRRFIDLYSSGGRDVFLAVYRNKKLYWIGSIEPEQYEEPYSYKENYITELTFNDLAVLERTKFRLRGRMSVADLVRAIVSDAFRPSFECDWIADIPRPEIVFNCSTRLASIVPSQISASTVFNDNPPDVPPTPNPSYPNPTPDPYDPDAPGVFDPNNPWQQQLQDTLQIRKGALVQAGEEQELTPETVQVLRSWHSAETSVSSLQSFTLGWGAGCLEKTYVNLDKFHADGDNEMDELEVLAAVLRPFTLRVEQRNGRIQIYDIHGVSRWITKPLKAKGADAVLGVDRVYNNAEITVSLEERSELMPAGDGIKRIKEPDYTCAVPNINTAGSYVGYNISLKKINPGAPEWAISHDYGSYLFNTLPVTVGSKERGVMVWMGKTPILKPQCAYAPFSIPDHLPRAKVIMQTPATQLSDTNCCYRAANINLPVRTKEIMDNFRLGLSLEVMFSINYSMYQPYTKDNVHHSGAADYEWLMKQFNGKAKVLRLIAKIYACDEAGNRLMILCSRQPGENADNWLDYLFLDNEQVWEEISTNMQQGPRQFAVLQFGSSLKDGFDIAGWNPIEEKSSGWFFSDGGDDVYNNRFVFPLPPKGVKLEVCIMNRPFFQLGFGDVTDLSGDPLPHFFRTFAMRGLDVSLLNKDGSAPSDEDLVLKAWLDPDANEEYTETLMFTSDKLALPNSLSLLTDASGGRLSHRFRRGKHGGTLEQLYLNSVFTAYSKRHNRIRGTYDPSRGLFPRLEEGKRYLVTGESEDCRMARSDLDMVEVEKDKYTATEIEIED